MFADDFHSERARLRMSQTQIAVELTELGFKCTWATVKNWEVGKSVPLAAGAILNALRQLSPLPSHLARFRG